MIDTLIGVMLGAFLLSLIGATMVGMLYIAGMAQ